MSRLSTTDLQKIYTSGTAKQLWEVWDEKMRTHFLIDHAGQFFELMGDDYNKSAKAYNTLTFDTLPAPIRKELVIHHAMGMYKEGGEISPSDVVKIEGQEGAYHVVNVNEKEKTAKVKKIGEMHLQTYGFPISKMTLLQKWDKKSEGGNVWTPEQKKAVAELDADFEKAVSVKEIKRNSKEASDFWREGGFKKRMNEIFNKMNNGGTIPPTKQKMQDRINILKETQATASPSAQKAIQAKIDKLQAKLDYKPTAKQLAQDNKGRFALDVPAKYSKAIYKKLWSMKIMPRIHKLNGTASIVVSSRNNLDKAYKVYSGISTEKVLPLAKISRKL